MPIPQVVETFGLPEGEDPDGYRLCIRLECRRAFKCADMKSCFACCKNYNTKGGTEEEGNDDTTTITTPETTETATTITVTTTDSKRKQRFPHTGPNLLCQHFGSCPTHQVKTHTHDCQLVVCPWCDKHLCPRHACFDGDAYLRLFLDTQAIWSLQHKWSKKILADDTYGFYMCLYRMACGMQLEGCIHGTRLEKIPISHPREVLEHRCDKWTASHATLEWIEGGGPKDAFVKQWTTAFCG